MLDKLKDMYALQKEAKRIKKELKKTHIEAELDGIIVTIDGEMEVQSIHIPEEMLTNKKTLEQNLVKAFNKGMKKAQQIAAEKMKAVMGGLGLPGM